MARSQRFLTLTLTLTLLSLLSLTAAKAQPPARGFARQADSNSDGAITPEELRSALASWLGGSPSATPAQFTSAVGKAFPESAFLAMISPPQNRTPKAQDVEKMMAALPAKAPAKPAKPRKLLVLNSCEGFVHSAIPLASKTMEELGSKTGAWTATVSYDASVITAQNLKQYDAILLNSTTGAFLDDPDPAVTAARKKALLDFVRSGKGLAGLHAAGDSYHVSSKGSEFVGMMSSGMFAAADKNKDQAVDAPELAMLADLWFEKLDPAHTGKVSVDAFKSGFGRVLFSTMGGGRRPGGAAPAAKAGPDPQQGTWPEFNRLIGGFFKYHWNDPTTIAYKIDDASSPLTAMFRGGAGPEGFSLVDETYTFSHDTWSRANLRVLASIDYAKMSDADKRKEDHPREDHDYGLSWIRREGKGRVFYSAHGHAERIYANTTMLEHWLAGIQYALGDLKVNDSPSARR